MSTRKEPRLSLERSSERCGSCNRRLVIARLNSVAKAEIAISTGKAAPPDSYACLNSSCGQIWNSLGVFSPLGDLLR